MITMNYADQYYVDNLLTEIPERYWSQNDKGEWMQDDKPSPYPLSVYSKNPDKTFQALVDQTTQNNLWSAQQAENQMRFQERLFNEANDFNANQAELNREFQQESANKAMYFSSSEAQKNRTWQKMMSNTAHQREMADLQAAGLNPILAANNGASAGTGSAALSAQAAGYGASSAGAPSGAKGDTDTSAVTMIANLLGKMLDNQTEIQKMIVSAETAQQTAEMYTGATKYAAELGSIASQYASDNSAAASRYGADISAQIASMNPYNILGGLINEGLSEMKNGHTSAGNVGTLQGIHDNLQSFAMKGIHAILDDSISNHPEVTKKETRWNRIKNWFKNLGK